MVYFSTSFEEKKYWRSFPKFKSCRIDKNGTVHKNDPIFSRCDKI